MTFLNWTGFGHVLVSPCRLWESRITNDDNYERDGNNDDWCDNDDDQDKQDNDVDNDNRNDGNKQVKI